MAKTMRATPTQLTGRSPRATKPSARQMTPSIPGPQSPGSMNSMNSPIRPMVTSTNATFGSDRNPRNSSRGVRSICLSSTSSRSRRISPDRSSTTVPSSCARRSARSSATRSTMFSSSASVAENDAASKTVDCSASTLRPRSLAISRRKAAASWEALRSRVSGRSSPRPTGDAAPMFVTGAMAAACAAAVRNVPAEAACAPSGATYTTTGVSELRMASTISLVESRRPPGVSSRMTSIRAPSSVALAMARFTNLAALGWIASSRSITATWGSAANTAATPWETIAPPRPSTTRPTAIARLIAPASQLAARQQGPLPWQTLRYV